MSAYVDQHRDRFGVEPICATLGVSASAYYARSSGTRSARVLEDERLLAVIRAAHAENYFAYGYRRMWKALARAGDWEGRAFFSFVIDVFSRTIVGWQLASNMRDTLVLDALRMALGLREHGADVALVAHSDAGSQYTSGDYTQTLNDH